MGQFYEGPTWVVINANLPGRRAGGRRRSNRPRSDGMGWEVGVASDGLQVDRWDFDGRLF